MSKRLRGIVFKIHGWVGAQLFLVLFVILSSGTLATLGHEIDWLLRPDMRAAASDQPILWQTAYDSVQAAFPDHDINSLHAPVGAGFAMEVLTTAQSGAYVRVYVDPGSGRVQGSHGWITAQRFLRNLHMNLYLNTVGIYLVSGFGFVLLVSLVTGLISYKRFWRGFFIRPRWRDGRTLVGDLHRLGGVWSLWFLMLIAVTGAWYFIEAAVDYKWERKPPEIPVQRLAAADARMISIEAMTAAARGAWPDFTIRYIVLPTTLDAPVTIGGQAGAVLVRDRGNLVYVHPVSAQVLRIKDAAEVPVIERWIDTADPLHFGDFGGLAGKLTWFVFGLILSFLSFSGFWLMLRRARQGATPHRPVARPAALTP